MLDLLNKILWAIATIFILYSGVYFSIKLRGCQFNIKRMVKNTFHKNNKEGISPFSSLMMVLAARIGVGSIAGIAIAIYYGGIGSIFWMWVTAILAAPNSFVETILGIIYREKDGDNIYIGGPSYYISKGLGMKKLGIIYALVVLFSYIGGFIGIQSNTITKSLNEIITINPVIIGLVLVFFAGSIIYGGVKRISTATSKLVPIMIIVYLMASIFIIVLNITKIPNIIIKIITSAFNFRSFLGGFIATLVIGIQRGIFSNEAGLGTGSIASSTVNTDDASSEGYVQMLGIYITTMLVCTSTAIVILTSNYNEVVFTTLNGIELTQYAFFYHLSNLGKYIVFISILLFSFSTILTGYYYGESSLKFIIRKIKPIYIFILKLLTLLVVFLGCLISPDILWKIVDIFVAILAIINIYALINLKDELKYIK